MCSPNVHYEHFFASTSNSISEVHNLSSGSNLRASLTNRNNSKTDLLAQRSRLSNEAQLQHTINQGSSVLSLAVDEKSHLLFSGSQEGSIDVWNLSTFQQSARLEGHTGSVLALELAPEKNWLFSSSGDNTVRVWEISTLSPLFVIYPAEENVGDIFALKWCADLETLYLGCQSTSIQWICLAGFGPRRLPTSDLRNPFSSSVNGHESPIISTPDLVSRPHKFFDSVPIALSRSTMGSAGTSTPNRARQQSAAKPDATAMGSGRPNLPVTTSSSSKTTDKILREAAQRLDDSHSAVKQAKPAEVAVTTHQQADSNDEVPTLLVPPSSSVPSAHFGYVYCFALLTLEGDSKHPTVLASGSGDETIKLWHATPAGLSLLATLESPNADGNAVMALASWKTTLFAGLQGGEVEVWDLETCTLVRTIRAHHEDVLCLETCPEEGFLFTASADGTVRMWDRSFRCVDRYDAHDGILLSLVKLRGQENGNPSEFDEDADSSRVSHLITGSSDNHIKIWDVPLRNRDPVDSRRKELDRFSIDSPSSSSTTPATLSQPFGVDEAVPSTSDSSPPQWALLLSLLRRIISIPSISSSEDNREDCRQAAHFLKTCFQELGAEARILPNQIGGNPLVLATFKANAYRTGYRGRSNRSKDESVASSRSQSLSSTQSEFELDSNDGMSASVMFDDTDQMASRKRRRCLFYGHYDCIAAEGSWTSEPFRLDGRDGYLYGRGISDNKGPILAAACAVSQLLALRRLQSDVVFLIEGEEENGSGGFIEAVRKYKEDVGNIDVILLSNSYWLDEDTPCLTIGLRGVVRATIKVSSDEPDVHSGVEGGAIREPMVDMVKLLSSLTSNDRVALPGFYDGVRAVTSEESVLYDSIAQLKRSCATRSTNNAETAASLMAKWRFPSLSVHNIRVSGPGNSTVIPSSVSANVSIRIVPDQDLSSIEDSLRDHVATVFRSLTPDEKRPSNKVEVSVEHRADWWLGSTSSEFFQILHSAVQQEWAAEPISIREGGSIPAIAILEKELGAPAVHLPMGQSSDSAHLPDERIRLVNLQKGQSVVRRFLEGIGRST